MKPMRHLHLPLLLCLLLLAVACQAAPPATPTPAGTTIPQASPTPQPTASTTPRPGTATPSPTPAASPTPFQPPDLRYLAQALDAQLDEFDSTTNGISSYTVIDLTSGQRIERNAGLAVAGASMLKIPILLDTYRVLDGPPDRATTRIITETATLSGNYTANLLLQLVAGRPDAYAGAQIVTQSLRRLGIYNTFIAVPYDEDALPAYPATYFTPANQRTDLTTNPDPARQVTTGDLATLLQMIYTCATAGSGPLIDTFPGELSAGECQAVLEQFQGNRIDAFIESGVPAGVPLAHKHGWIDDTHGDAGIVFSPNGDYVLAVALYSPGWLEWEISNPLIGELSRLTYAHFNDPAGYPPNLPPLPALPTPSPTPDLPLAIISNTGGAGLTLRSSPAGAEITVLPEGLLVYLLAEPTAAANGVAWQKIRTPAGEEGWVGLSYLTARP